MKLIAAIALTFSGSVLAAEIITAPEAPAYSIVTITSAKLKTSLAQALVAWPGKECTSFADLNGPINCPGIAIAGINTLDFAPVGFPEVTTTTVDSKGRVKTTTPRVDGLKQKYFLNALVNRNAPLSLFCPPDLGLPFPQPQGRPIEVLANAPLTEFSMEIYNNGALTEIEIEIDGAPIGNYIPVEGVQSVGVSEPAGMRHIKFIPRDIQRGQPYNCTSNYEYGWITGNRFFYQ
ncbi:MULTISPECIES: hypothetical protein [Methylomonas]|uniref:hypothetical protein n=1 Tax=Methylomonas TaxID=416 RepID=UPI001231FCF5|nr:hypothetical protein [Methylomonas rhizoryzae]